MYRTWAIHAPFDPGVPPLGYDIMKGLELSMYRHRLKGDIE